MTRPAPQSVPYGSLDRLLHRVAFASLDMQMALGDVENRLHAASIDLDLARRPVFVTSLPRAGTTVMLNLLAALPEFASATYRHMPFTLSPLLWDKLSRRLRRDGVSSERAHGDGVMVDYDSPEAFEEVLWMAFFPRHYGPEAIQPWDAGESPDGFEAFMRRHMAKIVGAKPGAARYLSKNNANVARLGMLARMFPDATVAVPIRHPWAQVASLLRQHRRFAELHAQDAFARRYMESIGHFEFGEALRPIAFGGAVRDLSEAGSPEFWLTYWCDAYESALAEAGERVVFVDHDALCAAPRPRLEALAASLDLAQPKLLTDQAAKLRPPAPAPAPDVPAPLARRALELHERLRGRALASAPEAA